MLLGIIDYGMGNLASVRNALDYLGVRIVMSRMTTMLEK